MGSRPPHILVTALLLSVKACAIESHRPEDSTTAAQWIQYQAQLQVQITQLLCNPPPPVPRLPPFSLLRVLKFHLNAPSKCFYFTPSCQVYCSKKCVTIGSLIQAGPSVLVWLRAVYFQYLCKSTCQRCDFSCKCTGRISDI